ncbi:MAG: TIM barrel protein [Zavarzinella sp.]
METNWNLTNTRRQFLAGTAIASATLLHNGGVWAEEKPAAPTEFQVACMTLPYSNFPFARALEGIRNAGYKFVALGTTHLEGGKKAAIIGDSTSLMAAKAVGKQCRDAGLEPLMMFSLIYPEATNGLKVLTQRLQQAAAAGIPQVLTFGHTKGGNHEVWIERLKLLGPIAEKEGVVLVIKQHGGETGTGAACAKIAEAVNHPHVQVNYDAGNVMDYLNVDPISDLKTCAARVYSFCIKDHRNFPKDEDCGPGLGEIDHYKLLHLVANLGRKIPLCCENIFAPLLPRPKTAEGVDAMAKRAREFLDLVIQGLQTVQTGK